MNTKPNTDKLFYLTFDGAPNPPGTDRILAVLARHGVRSTFFMEGHRVEKEIECGRRVLANGHVIGNHTYSHDRFEEGGAEFALADVQRADLALQTHLRMNTNLVRPPWGEVSSETERLLRQNGYDLIGWTISIRDWEGPDAAAVADRIINGAHPGGIVALHDHVDWTADVVDIVIPRLQVLGYYLCAIGEHPAEGFV
jgi:peptidoglycan-N-acetylglucosamine deacetylase